MKHNAEHEAVDLLLEVGLLDMILPFVDETNFNRVCLYLTQCSSYVPEPDDTNILKVSLFFIFYCLFCCSVFGDRSNSNKIYRSHMKFIRNSRNGLML